MSLLRTERAKFLVNCLDLPAAAQFPDAEWEHFQLAHLNDDSPFRVELKARQVAWSFTCAAEAIADAVLEKRGTLFISTDQNEAMEKIRYAKQVYENLDAPIKLPRMVRSNLLELEFDNGARLISFPSKAPRGKGQFNVDVDEWAWQREARAIYVGSLPILSKGGGRFRGGSSGNGTYGLFYDVMTDPSQYPDFNRKTTPWWEVSAFCTNVREARKRAPLMDTAERVQNYGNDRIKIIYQNMLLEDFQAEYEAMFVDESTAWVTWEEIRANQDPDLLCVIRSGREDRLDRALDGIMELARLWKTGAVERSFVSGVDIGRDKDTTELFVVGKTETGLLPLRLAVTLDNVEFDNQFQVLSAAMSKLPIVKMFIDRSSIGRNLTERLEKVYPGKVEGQNFTNSSKEVWATDARMLMQQRKTPIPIWSELGYQLHSIKRTKSASNSNVFDAERNKHGHADKTWALWLAYAAAGVPARKVYKVAAL